MIECLKMYKIVINFIAKTTNPSKGENPKKHLTEKLTFITDICDATQKYT